MNDSYYEQLKIKITTTTEPVDKCVTYLPEIFKTLTALLERDEVIQEDRLRINSALAYIVIPNDVVPEDIYGNWGYFDDLFIGALILHEMHSKYPEGVLTYWPISEDFNETINFCLAQSKHFLEEKNMIERVLSYAGLRY